MTSAVAALFLFSAVAPAALAQTQTQSQALQPATNPNSFMAIAPAPTASPLVSGAQPTCVAAETTWMRIDPSNYFLSGIDRCGGTTAPAVLFGTSEELLKPLAIDAAGLFDGAIELPPGDHIVRIRYSNGTEEELFTAVVDAPISFDVAMEASVGLTTGARSPANSVTSQFQANALNWSNTLTVNGRSFDAGTVSSQGSQLSLAAVGQPEGLYANAPVAIAQQRTAGGNGGLGLPSPQVGAESGYQPLFGATGSAVSASNFVAPAPTSPSAQGDASPQTVAVAPLEISAENSVWALMNRRAYAQSQILKEEQAAAAEAAAEPTAAPSPNRGGLFNFFNRNAEQQANRPVARPSPSAIEKNARMYPTDKEYFTVELIWNTPVDLDLHIFEPRAAGPRLPNSNAPGHVWSKASGALRSLAKGSVYQLESMPADRANREVYILPYNTIGALGDYDIRVDFVNRRVRQNGDNRFCGAGAYASPSALVRIRSPRLEREEAINIQPLSCSSPANAKLLLPVSVVNLL